MTKKMSSKSMKKLIDSMGGIEEVRGGFERHRKDFEYFSTHHQELLKSYPEEWVAIYNKAVIWHNNDFMDLMVNVDKETRSKAVVQHVTAKKRHMILVGASP